MSQICMSHDERVNALRRFGYTAPEAEFLCLAALHAGYFVRRQYAQFLGQESSAKPTALAQKALALEHVKVLAFDRNTHVYHLCTRPFYAAIGQADNRNRRDRQVSTIKNKLMGLDFVLAHPGERFLATEQEKVSYFAGDLHVEIEKLPTKLSCSPEAKTGTARYFVDKYPILLSDGLAAGPVVSFCFVDEGLITESRFETYLDEYARLFRALQRFQVIYVAATPRPFLTAERVFEKFAAKRSNGTNGLLSEASLQRLSEYFAAREQYEKKQYGLFDRAKLVRLRRDLEEFCGAQYDTAYERWKAGGEAALHEYLVPEAGPKPETQASFSTHLLEQNYDFFGTLTAF